MVELPVLVTKLDGREDVLVIHMYLVGAEVPSLCGKQTLEKWNLTINGKKKVLKLESKVNGSKMQIKMVDTNGGHYAIVLETKKTPDSNVLFLEDESRYPYSSSLRQGRISLIKAAAWTHNTSINKLGYSHSSLL